MTHQQLMMMGSCQMPNECNSCEGDLSCFIYSLTVSVDMSVEGFTAGDGSQSDGLDGSSMAISLNGGSWLAMTNVADNVWSYTFTELAPGDYTYNFNDGWYEDGPFGDCAVGQYGNDRSASIVDSDVTVPTVCWESCEECPDVISGCTDSSANNYDATATEDDGSCTYPTPMANLFFSEYAEGSSNNKYLEIYNASDVTVSLADYAYPSVSNAPTTVGEHEYWNTFDEGAEIAPGGVYIIAHPSSDASILAYANETHTYLSNGDDGYALAYGTEDNYVIMDHVGDFNGDPGSGWEVAGVSNATKDHTLVRKCSVEQGNSDWVASAGTNSEDSEWIVLDQDDWTNLGSHTTECADEEVLGCTDEAASNYNVDANTDDSSCLYSTVFNVDMSCSGEEFTSVGITTPVWGWPGDIGMTDEDGDGIYSITLDLPAGDFEYKYIINGFAGQENLVDDMQNGGTCAPITDYNAYANRLTSAGTTNDDTYGSCLPCGAGCTDEAAVNYDPDATVDDGSCSYCAGVTVNFSVDAGDVVSSDYDNVVANGTWSGWNGWGVTLTDADGDGIYTGSLVLDTNTLYQYVHALTGPADGWSGWGVQAGAPEECALGVDPVSGDAAPNYFFTTGGCGEVIDLPTVCFGACVECVEEVPGCTDASADNYDPTATVDDGSCSFCSAFTAVLIGTSDASSSDATDGSVQATGAGGSNNYDVSVVNAEGIPQNPFALAAGVYTVIVTDIDSDCTSSLEITILAPVFGCTDAAACNYDESATDDDGSCEFADAGYDCAGNCLADADGDGVCDDDEVVGCQDASACNYNASATDAGDCTFADAGYDCAGNCLADADGDGVCDDDEVVGCQDASACNYNASATDAGDCTFADAGYDCAGNCLADADGDGVCDDDEVVGCQDASACNYDETATDAGDCTFADIVYDCDGNCVTDTDGDGVCDEFEVIGCTDATATNFNPFATDDDGSCEYDAISDDPCDYVPTGLYVDNIIHNRVTFNWASPTVAPSHYMIRYREVGTSNSNWTVMTAGTINTNPFTGTSRTRWWMQAGTTYEWNIRARVLEEDGSNCQSAWSAPSQFTT